MKRIGVVGAGIIGAAIARELALAGCKVTVFEAHEPASGTSSRSMGWINASFTAREDYYRMRLAAIQSYRELDTHLNGALGVSWTGSLNWEASEAEFDAVAKELGSFGHPVTVVTRAEMAVLEPNLADLPEKALLMQNEGVAEGGHVAKVLLRAAQAAGAIVLAGAEVTSIDRQPNGIHAVNSAAGRILVDDVVIATGIKTGEMAEKCGFPLPMKNQPGVLIETTPLPFRLNHTIWSPDVHFKQLADGRAVCGNLFSGAVGDEGVDGLPERMLERLKQRLPAAAGSLSIEKVRHGIRPMPVDTYPAIGRLGADEANSYVAVTHSGITLGPLIGRLVAQEIVDGVAHPMLQAFRPSRFNL